MWPQDKEAGPHQKLVEAKEGFSLKASRGSMALPTSGLISDFWLPELRENKQRSTKNISEDQK